MKTIREMVDLIPEHVLDMDLERTFLVGVTTTDVEVQVDRLNELGAITGRLSDEDALKVLQHVAENFDPEVGVGNELIRKAIVELVSRKDVVLV